MQVTLPACITAGVLLTSAGIVVGTPAVPRHSDVQVPAVQLSDTEGVDPIAAWTNVFPDAAADLEMFGVDVLEPPPAADVSQPDPVTDFHLELQGIFSHPASPSVIPPP
jgi:hypothetical protein